MTDLARPRSFVGLTAFAALSAIGVSWYRGELGDYPHDASGAVDALAGGHVLRALTVHPQPLMGAFAILARAPFVAIGHWFGAGSLASYRIGAIPCLVAAGLLAVVLLRTFPPASRRRAVSILVVLLAVASPAATNAVELGHPEEVLCAALSVLAVVAAMRGRFAGAAVLLGLALATKQWAVIALPPTALAVGRPYRWRVAAGAIGLATLLTLPQVLADPSGFASVSQHAATSTNDTFVQSWWYLIGHTLPGWLARSTHPAIVLAAFSLTVIAYRRGIRAEDALPLLVLLFLIRCVFDPVDNYYYHLPLLMALLAWDVQLRRRLPYATLAATVSLIVTNSFIAGTPASAFYFAWTAALAVVLVVVLRRATSAGASSRSAAGQAPYALGQPA
jgi:uncharacterized membrane protein